MIKFKWKNLIIFGFEELDYREYPDQIEEFTNTLKLLIPEPARQYYSHTDHWHINEDYETTLNEIIKTNFKNYRGLPRGKNVSKI